MRIFEFLFSVYLCFIFHIFIIYMIIYMSIMPWFSNNILFLVQHLMIIEKLQVCMDIVKRPLTTVF